MRAIILSEDKIRILFPERIQKRAKNKGKSMKIKVVIPVITKGFEKETKKEVERFVSEGTEIDLECIEYGTASIESMYDGALCGPGIIKLAERAQSEGFDGIFIDCMGDPALDAVRERLDIPVVGPARVSMLYAAELSHKFSIVTTVKNIVVSIENLAKGLGLNEKLASVRVVNIPVLNLKNKEKLVKALIDESVKAVEDDGAHAIILGCTGMMGVAEDLSKALVEKGHKVPVIYPVAVSIKYLETLISLNLAQSKKTYMHPPEKERNVLEKLR